MILMKNFSVKNVDVNGIIIAVATDETGADWYESQKNFTDDTLKIVFDSAGVIVSMNYDVTTLWPGGNSIAEVAAVDVPEGVNIYGGWVFDGKKVIPRVYTPEELAEQAATKRSSLMTLANAAIAPLQNAVDVGMATESEIELLTEWKIYTVNLNRVDVENPVWPEPPC